MKTLLLSAALALLLFIPEALAAEANIDPSFSIDVPSGWETLDTGLMSLAPKAVTSMIDCAREDPSNAKQLGYKLAEDGTFLAAYCISFQRSGMGKLRNILKSSTGENRQKASDKFIDTFASKLHEEYGVKRKMAISGLSADLMDADKDVIMVMDGKVKAGESDFMRSLLIFLHNDSLLNIGFIHAAGAPSTLVEQLDAIPVSLKWK